MGLPIDGLELFLSGNRWVGRIRGNSFERSYFPGVQTIRGRARSRREEIQGQARTIANDDLLCRAAGRRATGTAAGATGAGRHRGGKLPGTFVVIGEVPLRIEADLGREIRSQAFRVVMTINDGTSLHRLDWVYVTVPREIDHLLDKRMKLALIHEERAFKW